MCALVCPTYCPTYALDGDTSTGGTETLFISPRKSPNTFNLPPHPQMLRDTSTRNPFDLPPPPGKSTSFGAVNPFILPLAVQKPRAASQPVSSSSSSSSLLWPFTPHPSLPSPFSDQFPHCLTQENSCLQGGTTPLSCLHQNQQWGQQCPILVVGLQVGMARELTQQGKTMVSDLVISLKLIIIDPNSGSES